jgi:hypothetical protein
MYGNSTRTFNDKPNKPRGKAFFICMTLIKVNRNNIISAFKRHKNNWSTLQNELQNILRDEAA